MNEIKSPLVSAIIPVYNRENTIAAAIDSVLNQSYSNIEIIVINDASTDKTEAILLDKYSDKIVYIKNDQNKGVSFSRNTGIAHAKGEYIAFLDSDDVWFSFHIMESIKTLQMAERSVCCALWTENCYGEIVNICESPYFRKYFREKLNFELGVDIDSPIWLFPDSIYEFILKTDFYFYQINTLVVNRNVLNRIGAFDESMKSSEDMDLCYRIFRYYPPVVINKSHFIYNYGYDNLWAFTDREKRLNEFSNDEKKKLTLATLQKIEFYKRILKSVKDDNELSNNQEVIENICSNIVKRYLTISYLLECEDYQNEIYKYSISNKLKKIVENKSTHLNDFLIID